MGLGWYVVGPVEFIFIWRYWLSSGIEGWSVATLVVVQVVLWGSFGYFSISGWLDVQYWGTLRSPSLSAKWFGSVLWIQESDWHLGLDVRGFWNPKRMFHTFVMHPSPGRGFPSWPHGCGDIQVLLWFFHLSDGVLQWSSEKKDMLSEHLFSIPIGPKPVSYWIILWVACADFACITIADVQVFWPWVIFFEAYTFLVSFSLPLRAVDTTPFDPGHALW